MLVIAFYYFRPKKKLPTESIYTKALNAIIQGDKNIALKHLKDVVKQDTKEALRQIHKSLALDYYKLDNLNRAKEEAEIIIKSNKKNLWANEFLLEIYEAQNKWKEAAQLSKMVQRIKASKDPDQLSRFLVFQSMDKIKNNQTFRILYEAY